MEKDNIITEESELLGKFLTNSQNTLDILAVLWENIVLEVPLRFTKVRDLSKFHGDGWKLVSEDELNKRYKIIKEMKPIIEKSTKKEEGDEKKCQRQEPLQLRPRRKF